MRRLSGLFGVVLLCGAQAWAQSELTPPPPPATAPPAEPAPPPEPVQVKTQSIGVHIGLNVGLFMVDVHHDHLYGFAAGNVGVPLLSNGTTGAFAIGFGYSLPLSKPGESMWFMDVFGEGLPGWISSAGTTAPVVAFGVGLGFRYLHTTGFVVGFKLPVFGSSFSSALGYTASTAVSYYYLHNLIALPVVSFGYRF